MHCISYYFMCLCTFPVLHLPWKLCLFYLSEIQHIQDCFPSTDNCRWTEAADDNRARPAWLCWHPTNAPLNVALFEKNGWCGFERPESKTKTKTRSWLCRFLFPMMMMVVVEVCFPFCLVISADSFQQNCPTVRERVFCSPFEYGWQNIVGRLVVTSLFFTPSSNAANQASYYHHKGHSVIESFAAETRSSYMTRRDKFVTTCRHAYGVTSLFHFQSTMHSL